MSAMTDVISELEALVRKWDVEIEKLRTIPGYAASCCSRTLMTSATEVRLLIRRFERRALDELEGRVRKFGLETQLTLEERES